jgi:hypothetical protein
MGDVKVTTGPKIKPSTGPLKFSISSKKGTLENGDSINIKFDNLISEINNDPNMDSNDSGIELRIKLHSPAGSDSMEYQIRIVKH